MRLLQELGDLARHGGGLGAVGHVGRGVEVRAQPRERLADGDGVGAHDDAQLGVRPAAAARVELAAQ